MLIGLAGKAGVGKTTIAKIFEERQGFVIATFAYPLKKSLSELTGLSMSHFMDIELKEKVIPEIGKSPRQLMQLMGTEFVREMVHPEFWILRMENTLRRLGPDTDAIIDDCRFENEVDMVRRLGGIVVHLERSYDCPTTQVNHKSESSLRIEPSDLMVFSDSLGPDYTFNKILEGLSFMGFWRGR